MGFVVLFFVVENVITAPRETIDRLNGFSWCPLSALVRVITLVFLVSLGLHS
jgi:hypothetical protein